MKKLKEEKAWADDRGGLLQSIVRVGVNWKGTSIQSPLFTRCSLASELFHFGQLHSPWVERRSRKQEAGSRKQEAEDGTLKWEH